MRAFWATEGDRLNFGDGLTPYLFAELAGVALEWAPIEEAELIAAGSIVDWLPPGWTGAILGAGAMFEQPWLDVDAARILALRGRLTAQAANQRPALLADFGLLAGELATAADRDIELGTFRHFVDERPAAGLALDPFDDPATTIAAAARCRRITSSSLHGLVLADALGIPNLWDPHPGVHGAGYKFRDYASAYGERIEPYRWRLADQLQVAAKRAALLEQLRAVAAALPA